MNTRIYHIWQLYDNRKEKWITTDKVNYPIIGGRDGGYRGYTYKRNIQTGDWRINVETENEKLLGRISFEIQKTKVNKVKLVETTY